MRLWKKASGLIKDQNSLWLVSLSKRTAFRNPEMESAVIKATSHNEFTIDMKNVDRVYKWLRLSPSHLKSLIWAISMRMKKSKSWVVVIKGLMLMHGIYSSKLPDIQRIGRLPFDLSNFKDGHSNPSKMWGINAFIRAYFTYLDQKSSLLFMNLQERKNLQNFDNINNIIVAIEETKYSMIQDLVLLQKLQYLLDMLLEIRPLCDFPIVPLVLEAMDCVMIEIFNVYSRICNGIARVLLRIYSAGKVEASMALRIVRKAAIQGEELSLYFDLCRRIGVKNATNYPRVECIPDEDIKELEEIIHGVFEKASQMATQQIVVQQDNLDGKRKLKTIITHNWETFDEDLMQKDGSNYVIVKVTPTINPFASSLVPSSTFNNVFGKPLELPDLISFF